MKSTGHDLLQAARLAATAAKAALQSADVEEMRQALLLCQALTDSVAAHPDPVDLSSHIVTVFDESCGPFGREFDIQVDYQWQDFDITDAPHAPWGAQIRQAQVVAVRYLNEQGESVSIAEHHADACDAWLRENWEQLQERCTQAGSDSGGVVSPLYAATPPTDTGNQIDCNNDSPRRMSPSAPPHQLGERKGNVG